MLLKQMYTAEVIADSISPHGHRITTLRVIYPHAVHKDLLRHRCMNRNVESFRAQPPEKLIAALRKGHAFIPDVFGYRTKGMGQRNEAIDGEKEIDQEVAQRMWAAHVEEACTLAERMLTMNIAKQQVNFVLQDLCPLTEVITATDWSNFYALRTELNDDGTPVARPEVYKTAVAIREAIQASDPVGLDYGQLHLPMITDQELDKLCKTRLYESPTVVAGAEDYWIGVSAGRCAKISYGDYQWWKEEAHVGHGRSRRLLGAGHMSPFEQQARVFSRARWALIRTLQSRIGRSAGIQSREQIEMRRQLEYSGNLRGWVPARKEFPNEWDYSELRAA